MENAPTKENFAALETAAREFHDKSRGSHGWDHTERVLRLCLHLGSSESADPAILRAAALLHDIGRPEEDASLGRICHAERGAALAGEMMSGLGLPPVFVQRVVHCIEAHRFRGGKSPATIEAKILFDADKLDSIGAVGIGRAFLFAGEVGARLHNPDLDVVETKAYSPEDTAYREFMVKLVKVSQRMLTASGAAMAAGRHDFMVDFFRRLDQEVLGEV